MLVKDISIVHEILRCPVCQGEMSSELTCLSCGQETLKIDGKPAMFNFARSIFTEESITPNLAERVEKKRSSRLGRFLRRVTFGKSSQKSSDNVGSLIKLVENKTNTRILVIGGGTVGSLGDLYGVENIEIVGTDVYPSELTTLVCDGHQLPFKNEAFDAVIAQAVLEHVLDPKIVVSEMTRVLKKGGIVYAETPFMQQVHEGAYDFTRYTRSGHRWLFREFEEIAGGAILGTGVALIWSIRYYVKSLGFGDRVASAVAACFFWVRLAEPKRPSIAKDDAASGVFFLGRKATKAMLASDMPAYYESGY